ncbi:MAG: AAA family ATPase [Pseudomonadota bacterium]
MILEGNERAFGGELAHHLMNPRDNDHVTVHAVEGFIADDLRGAFAEIEAIAEATQCQKYLFSLSLNPPIGPTVPVEAFEDAIARTERKLGLVGQPRVVVFHEKNGRRHAHCVWSKIDGAALRAINLSHYKRKLGDVSRELYRTHDWDMPSGFEEAAKRDPQNYSRAEAGQAKRAERDPKALKATFRRCWDGSDSRVAFEAALKEQGFLLARGDQRGFVGVDVDGKIWSLSRWCGVKPKELRARLGSEEGLPSIEEVLAEGVVLARPKAVSDNPVLEQRRQNLVTAQRTERANLLKEQEVRRIAELKARQAALPRGLRAVFLRMTGRYDALVRDAKAAFAAAQSRDRAEQQALITKHLAERRALQRELARSGLSAGFGTATGPDPRQVLHDAESDLPLSKAELIRNPARVLAEISKTSSRFDRADVLRELIKRIDDPLVLKELADRALTSPSLVRLGEGPHAEYTIKDYLAAEAALTKTARRMAARSGFGVGREHCNQAIATQNAVLRRAFGGQLSAEQCSALEHILGERQFAMVVGLAGAGKSTMLAAASDAWRRQGITVHGAALAGKAADGLESASGIQSRTLASLEASWESGNTPIAKGDVLVVDEAGMIGTRQLSRIAQKIDEIGAKLVLIGDPDQLQPIEAGTPFRDLIATHGAARLTEIHRQKDGWQRKASRDLAAGRVAEAVAAYAKKGAVTQGTDAFDALVETYAMDNAADGEARSRLAFAHRRKDVHALNQAIRAALRPSDEPRSEVLHETATGPRAFAAGDRIVFGRNDRDLGVKNGMLGTVEDVGRSKLVVTLDGDPPQKVTVDPRRYQHFDHGYAVTIHKSQGATVDQAYVLASRSMDRHLAYVAMTRHRSAMQLFVRNKDRPRWFDAQHRRDFGRDPPQRSGPSMC